MTILSYEQSRLQPLDSDLEVERRVDTLIGRAHQRQLWLLFLDEERVQLPLLIPVEHLPSELPEAGGSSFALAIHDTARTVGAASVVIVLEELHGPEITARDRAWAKAIHEACEAEGVPVRGILLSHRGGVRWMPQHDYLAA